MAARSELAVLAHQSGSTSTKVGVFEGDQEAPRQEPLSSRRPRLCRSSRASPSQMPYRSGRPFSPPEGGIDSSSTIDAFLSDAAWWPHATRGRYLREVTTSCSTTRSGGANRVQHFRAAGPSPTALSGRVRQAAL